MVGLVPQDIFLFSETIRENIAFGVNELPDPVLQVVTQTASIHDEVMEFPDRYESMIGERGINLSGGQKQRVAIARALVNRPSMVLCDEPTGNLDSRNAATLMELLDRLNADGLTIVVITHDAAVAAHAGRTVAISDGILSERTGAGHA
jgi:ABC-type bacteriocin/lantibiotic exporter with double-glycine peptidase domain